MGHFSSTCEGQTTVDLLLSYIAITITIITVVAAVVYITDHSDAKLAEAINHHRRHDALQEQTGRCCESPSAFKQDTS